MATTIPKELGPNFIKFFKDSNKALRLLKKVDPRERYVLLYPGSDHVHVGMGFSLLNVPPAEEVFSKASDILKKDLLKLCLNGPKSELLGTLENRHLAAFVTSHAAVAKLANERPPVIEICKAAGGVGVGFVNSLVFSGAMSFENGLDLVQRQGKAMDHAAKMIPSAKIRVRIRPATNKSRVCRAAMEYCVKKGIPAEVAVCSVTKQTKAHVIEIAGHEEAINYLEREGKELFEFMRLSRVEASPQAYHTNLMMPAKEFLSVYLNQKIKEDPNYLKEPQTCSVYSSTSGCRLRTIDAIRKDLRDYPVKPILIEQLLHCLFARPKSLPPPNTLVVWDDRLLKTLMWVNRKAWVSAKLLEARHDHLLGNGKNI